jgi:VirE N-terminal domain/Primase C terminal 2 (PriCT-2)
MINIELFPKVNDRSTHSVQSLQRLLKWSTSNETLKQNTCLYQQWLKDNPNATKQEKSQKKLFYFPAVTFGGTFTGTGTAKDINIMSGLIVLDFDHIKNLAEVRQKLENDSNTFLLFVSPSGDGLKVVVKHGLTDPLKWQYLYFELEAYYLNTFGLETDKSGKDISRMCFLPYIDTLFKNDNSTVWQYTGTFEKGQLRYADICVPLIPDISTATSTTDDLYNECFYISVYLFQNKISIAESYEDWLSYGYSICALDEKGREIFHNISCISDKYDVDNCNEQYDYMLCHYDEDRTNINNFINNGKRAIAHHTIYKQYGFLCQ